MFWYQNHGRQGTAKFGINITVGKVQQCFGIRIMADKGQQCLGMRTLGIGTNTKDHITASYQDHITAF